jgi:D-amino-acid dehydrogenase
MQRVVVIGAGIVGLATAVELVWRGASVTVIDPREPGSAASSGNTGWIVPALSAPVPAPGLPKQVARWMLDRDAPFRVDLTSLTRQAAWLRQFWSYCNPGSHRHGLLALGRLNAAAYSGFQRWADAGLAFEWDEPGVSFVAREAETVEHVADELEALTNWGYAAPHWLSGSELRELHKELSTDIQAGVRAVREQIVRPESVIDALVGTLSGSAQFVQGTVESIKCRDGRVSAVVSGHRDLLADNVVIAAGAWSGRIGQLFDMNLPVLGGKGYSITVSDPDLRLSSPLYLADAKIACTPFAGANRFAGMMEITGTDDSIESSRVATMTRHLDKVLPGWERGSSRHVWAGLRPMTPDGLPLIGKIPDCDNVYAATGHGMLGVTTAPVTGEIISELIVNGASPHDVSAFDPARF